MIQFCNTHDQYNLSWDDHFEPKSIKMHKLISTLIVFSWIFQNILEILGILSIAIGETGWHSVQSIRNKVIALTGAGRVRNNGGARNTNMWCQFKLEMSTTCIYFFIFCICFCHPGHPHFKKKLFLPKYCIVNWLHSLDVAPSPVRKDVMYHHPSQHHHCRLFFSNMSPSVLY
jgi:hypothetical protein